MEQPNTPNTGLRKVLGVAFGLAVVVGSTIGVGILRTPGTIAGYIPNAGFILLCWILIGAFNTVTATVIGIGLFALGESTQAPRFYEYVSNLAPKGQTGTFMGFAFLPIAIGSFSAGALADWLRTTYLETDPSMMWYIVAGIGIVSTLLMVGYNFAFAPRKA